MGKKIIATITILALALTTLSARSYYRHPSLFRNSSVGLGMSSDIVLTDFTGTEYFERVNVDAEFAMLPQSSTGNLIFRASVSMYAKDFLGRRASDSVFSPVGYAAALLRYQPFDTGFAIAGGAGVYLTNPSDDSIATCLIVEPSVAIPTAMKTDEYGTVRINFPVMGVLIDSQWYLSAGVGVMLYIC